MLIASTLLASCANAPDAAMISKGAAPGVTPTQIDVGALATQSGPLAADFGAIVPGVKAYFSWINAHGGVWGRKLVLAHNADDGGVPSNNATQARILVQQDHVFAIVGVATAFFAASTFLAQTGTPTFGYATQDEWQGPPNLFAAYGSAIDFGSAGPFIAYAASRAHATSVGLMAYGIPQSAEGCQVGQQALEQAGIKVGYSDLSVPYGGDMTSDVLRMKQAHVDFVIACMDVNGNLQLARTIRQNGMGDVAQFWLDGYDTTTLAAYGPLMTNTYFLVQHVPFEAASEFPGAFPGLEQYLAVMHRFAPSVATNEVAIEGWISAALFVEGLRIAGPHPTQQAVINAINHLGSFTANGLMLPVDWRIAHHAVSPPSCTSFSKTVTTASGKEEFAVAFNKGSDVWTCFPLKGKVDLSHPVPAPPGVPGT
jgi:branched-chain amino acid transport system substrate-binding protein